MSQTYVSHPRDEAGCFRRSPCVFAHGHGVAATVGVVRANEVGSSRANPASQVILSVGADAVFRASAPSAGRLHVHVGPHHCLRPRILEGRRLVTGVTRLQRSPFSGGQGFRSVAGDRRERLCTDLEEGDVRRGLVLHRRVQRPDDGLRALVDGRHVPRVNVGQVRNEVQQGGGGETRDCGSCRLLRIAPIDEPRPEG